MRLGSLLFFLCVVLYRDKFRDRLRIRKKKSERRKRLGHERTSACEADEEKER